MEFLVSPFLSFSSQLKKLNETKLWLKVLIGMVLGIALGVVLGPDLNWVKASTATNITDWLTLPGNLFLKLVKMIIIPLVFSSIIIGIITSGDPEFIKKIGPRVMLFILVTTTIAIIIGLSMAYAINPGSYINSDQLEVETPVSNDMSPIDSELFNTKLPQRIVDVLPDNPLASMVSGEMLGVVLFTVILGIALLGIPTSNLKTIISLLETFQQASMIIVRWAMELAPYAVFGLMTQLASKIGLETLSGLAMYVLTVVTGLFIMFIVYVIIMMTFVKVKARKFVGDIKEVLLLAFSTSSSAAVMPLSMKVCEEKLGVKPAISRFMIPVGATVNMAGTALYQSTAAVFLAQVFGIDLSFSSLLLIVVITVAASIGTPSAPGVGIVILATILESVGIPGSGIALILGVDRILDMSRTAINVTGDITAAAFFNKQLAHLFQDKT